MRSGMPLILFVALLVPLAHGASVQSRYLPHVTDSHLIDRITRVGAMESPHRYWKTRGEILGTEERSNDTSLPLTGLHLALDPGHIGGEWAADEAREFRIHEDDLFVREGELVLEIAHEVRNQLVRLGATVSLLRTDSTPVNPKRPIEYIPQIIEDMGPVTDPSLIAMSDYAFEVRRRAVRQSIVVDEIAIRAQRVNEIIQPDILLSLHLNAAKWPSEDGVPVFRLVDSNHLHVLVLGCFSTTELSLDGQLEELEIKLSNGSGAEELYLADALAHSLLKVTGLPPAVYTGDNAVQPDRNERYVWARNLMILRKVECPAVMLEPYITNSCETYPRIQKALRDRRDGAELASDDILLEYANGVVEAILVVYGSQN